MQRLRTWQLFAICVLVWGTTWHAITYQLSTFPAELGVALRFAIAGAAALAFSRLRGDRLAFSRADHAALALQGSFLYGFAYVCVYHAERFVPSGLVAVGYSASPLAGGIGAAWLFGSPLTRRFLLGGVLGLAGVALIFWPEFGKAQASGHTSLGVAFTVGSVLLSTVGSLLASRNGPRGLTMWPSLGFGMLYGGAAVLMITLASGQSLAWPTALSWWLALVYLALAGSVLSFACYLTLLDRLGAGPAGSIGVMTPILALVVSTVFENYRPDVLAALGVLLALAGNVLILRKPPIKAASRAAE
jgi:drug/metabolite transporter (DMT)-like permease